jgi:hypothetical protein
MCGCVNSGIAWEGTGKDSCTAADILFSIGSVASADVRLDFQGLVDEVRLSDTLLRQEALLISQFVVREPSALSLFAIGTVALALARRRGPESQPDRSISGRASVHAHVDILYTDINKRARSCAYDFGPETRQAIVLSFAR